MCGRISSGILPHAFFERDTVVVARELLGREIWREVQVGRSSRKPGKSVLLRARIVETEAYLEKNDPAAHCSRGPTPRAKVMFGAPGTIYVYFIYGNYYMLNFVTERVGQAGAVLIRAVEPLEGISVMASNRGLKGVSADFVNELTPRQLQNLTNGPAKLVLALGIDGGLNGTLLGTSELEVREGIPVNPENVVTTTRIGINVAKDLPLRFFERGNPFVSKV